MPDFSEHRHSHLTSLTADTISGLTIVWNLLGARSWITANFRNNLAQDLVASIITRVGGHAWVVRFLQNLWTGCNFLMLQAAINRNGATSCEDSCVGLLSRLCWIRDQALDPLAFPHIEPNGSCLSGLLFQTCVFLLKERPTFQNAQVPTFSFLTTIGHHTDHLIPELPIVLVLPLYI
jgi:hypothetical protein